MRQTVIGLLLVCMALLAGSLSYAQTTGNATVSGTVTDPTGAVIPKAKVVLLDNATNLSHSQETNDGGQYIFLNVLPATYKLTVAAPGFRQAVIPSLKVSVAKSHLVDVAMEVGGTTEVVEVTAGARIELQTSDATVGDVVAGEALQRLPTVDRSAASLLLLQPLVVGGGFNVDDTRGGQVAGSRSDQNTFFLDGGDATNDTEGSGGYAFRRFDGFPLAVVPVPVESVEEFRVSTTNPNATFSRSAGAAINLVTKRGTNNLHGSAYWYHQNDNLNANTWDLNRVGQKKPELKDNRYGFSVGGPVFKGRTFLYGHFEGRRFPRAETITRIVPRDTLKQGILHFQDASGAVRSYNLATSTLCGSLNNSACDPRGLGIPQLMKDYFALYPDGNDESLGDKFNTIGFRGPANFSLVEDFAVARLDQKITDKWNFYASYRYNRRKAPDVGQIDIAGITGKGPKGQAVAVANSPVEPRYVVAALDGQITPHLASQFRFSWTRNWWEWQRTNPFPQLSALGGALDVGGDATIGTLSEPMNVDTQQARSRVWNGLDSYYSENLAWLKGAHTLEFGGSFRRWDIFHRRNDKVVGAVDSLIYFSNTERVRVPDTNRPPTCGGSITTFCLQKGDETQWDILYINALGLIDRATILLTRDVNDNLNPLPLGTPLTAKVKVDAYDFFAQDTWRIKPSFTFTFGLSYNVQVPPQEREGKQMVEIFRATGQPVDAFEYLRLRAEAARKGQIYNPELAWSPIRATGRKYTYDIDWNNFGPRVSAAWSPAFTNGFFGWLFGSRKTVIRGGYSLTYDRINGVGLVMTPLLGVGLGEILQCQAPNTSGVCTNSTTTPSTGLRIGVDATTINMPTPTAGRVPFTVPAKGESSSRLHDPGRVISENHSLNLTWQREVPGDMIVEFGYVGKFGRELLTNIDINSVALFFLDPASNQTFAQAFDSVAEQLRAGVAAGAVTPQGWFENQLVPANVAKWLKIAPVSSCSALPLKSCTATLASNFRTSFITGNITNLTIFGIDFNGLGPNPLGFNNIQSTGNQLVGGGGKSWYNAGFVSVRKRMSFGLTFGVNYTYAQALDTRGLNQQYVTGAVNPFDFELSKSPALFDRTHTLNSHLYYEFPFGRGRRWNTGNWFDKVIGGWHMGSVFNAMSGLPLCVTHGGNWGAPGGGFESACAYGPKAGDNTAHKGVTGSGGVGTAGDINLFADPEAVFNSFRRQLYSVDGRTGRGILRGMPFWELDLSVGKRTPVTEAISVSFGFDFVNIFNHNQLDDPPSLSLASPKTFGVLTSQFNSPRRIQVGLRVDF